MAFERENIDQKISRGEPLSAAEIVFAVQHSIGEYAIQYEQYKEIIIAQASAELKAYLESISEEERLKEWAEEQSIEEQQQAQQVNQSIVQTDSERLARQQLQAEDERIKAEKEKVERERAEQQWADDFLADFDDDELVNMTSDQLAILDKKLDDQASAHIVKDLGKGSNRITIKDITLSLELPPLEPRIPRVVADLEAHPDLKQQVASDPKKRGEFVESAVVAETKAQVDRVVDQIETNNRSGMASLNDEIRALLKAELRELVKMSQARFLEQNPDHLTKRWKVMTATVNSHLARDNTVILSSPLKTGASLGKWPARFAPVPRGSSRRDDDLENLPRFENK